jgi:hypothetical protein
LKNPFIPLFAGVILLAAVSHAAESYVYVKLDTRNPGAAIAPDFSGLSFEISILRPAANGVRYFRPDNQPLITLFHTLGIKSLRIGGNTSDRDARQLPDEADLDSLFAFAKAARVKVIYCLRLHNGDAAADAQTAKYIMSRYADQMDCFSIGQEPSAYPAEKIDTRAPTERMGVAAEKYQYTNYAADWQKFAAAIVAAEPDVKFCGPSVHNNGDWARKFMTDFALDHHVALITEHLYPGGAGGKVPTPEIGRDRMLSDEFTAKYQKLYDSFGPMAESNGLPFRLEEVNNYFNGGATNVSNTFASALWGLDFMYWWAAHDAAGLNFHTGDKVAAGNSLQASKYTAFFTTTNGYLIRPLGYGIAAFNLGSHGRFIPAKVVNHANLNLSIYSVLGDDKSTYVTIINKEHGTNANDARISLGPAFRDAQLIRLTAPNGDIAGTSGETLGDTLIANDGSWDGTWKSAGPALAHGIDDGAYFVIVPAASAVILKLSN